MPVFSNPVIPGFHPDPSLCRVGSDYYLVVSSFAFLPGIPVFHSTNLTDWTPIGHVFDRPDALDLSGLQVSDGLWAPTIRHHEGIYYVVTTIARNYQGAMTVLATATDPAGPWSDPIDLGAEGIDPSLFFDDDGRCWFTACRDAAQPNVTGPGELWLRELDLTTLTLIGPTHILWHGAMRGAWIEAPHIYRNDGRFFLIGAEGGTEGNHSVTVASADSVTGPYSSDPRNPLLTHRHLGPDATIQNVGHADLVDTADGHTWAVVLGTRPIDGFHVLGREVFLVPVSWSPQGPVFSPGLGQVRLIEEKPLLQNGTAGTPTPAAASGQQWLGLRELPPVVSPTGDLVLQLRQDTLSGTGRPAFMGRRQTHPSFVASLVVDFAPNAEGEEAGLAIHQGAAGYATATLRHLGGARVLTLTLVSTEGASTIACAAVPVGPLRIFASAQGLDYAVHYQAQDDPQQRLLGRIDGRNLSTERVGGFVGVVLGPYASSHGQASTASATFSDFSYAELIPAAGTLGT